MEDGLTSEELLRRVPIPGKRPDAVLKRLRRADLVARPSAKPRGRGKGVAQIYPAIAEHQLRRVTDLRAAGVRSEKELRWSIWWAGADELWPRVQADLVAAFPRAEQAELDARRAQDPESLMDAIEYGSAKLAQDWERSRHPAYDRRAVRGSVEVRTLTQAVIGAAIPGEEPFLSAPLDDTESPDTVSDLLDRAWGVGAGFTLEELIAKGITDSSRWEAALRAATVARARAAASIWQRAFGPERLKRERAFFGADWSDRALLVASLLYALEAGLEQRSG